MNRIHAKLRMFVERLIALETRKGEFPESDPAVFLVVERLRPHFSTLMGNVGFHALLSRALVLAQAEVPWLRTVQVDANGSLEKLDETEADAKLDPDEILEGRVVLLVQLFGLLVAFIGEALTLRLVREVWPKVAVHNLDFNEGDKK